MLEERRARPATAGYALVLVLCGLAWPEARQAESSDSGSGCAAGWVEAESQADASTRLACGGGARRGAPVRGPARLLVGLPIELNRASAATLEVLPGIGPRRAAAIVAERCRRPFERLADLQRVHGIGPRTAWRLRGWAAPGTAAPDRCRTPTLPP